ncbi:MAG: 2-oxoacid:acceptor oxidoreductase family protein, partial [Desulfurococcaceae archaeon]
MELLKRPITSTAMLGALVKATNIVSMNAVVKALKERFPSPLAERNIELVKRAFEKTIEV